MKIRQSVLILLAVTLCSCSYQLAAYSTRYLYIINDQEGMITEYKGNLGLRGYKVTILNNSYKETKINFLRECVQLQPLTELQIIVSPRMIGYGNEARVPITVTVADDPGVRPIMLTWLPGTHPNDMSWILTCKNRALSIAK